MDYAFAYPWAKKDLIKETSIYTTRLKITELGEYGALSKIDENWVKVVVYGEGEPMCCDKLSNPNGPFFFFYDTFFTKLRLRLPLKIKDKNHVQKTSVYRRKSLKTYQMRV